MSVRDEIVKCPFDEHHRVSRARFPVHLIKCRKQHKGKNFSICPYNATHYILTPEFQFHLENCPDRKEKEITSPVPDETYKPPKTEIKVPPPAETWDEDGDNVSYLDVKDNLISKLPVLRAPSGMTKSERKKFMRREVHRFHNLGKGDPSTSKESNGDDEGGEFDEESDFATMAAALAAVAAEPTPCFYAGKTVEDPFADIPDEVDDDDGGDFCVVKKKGSDKRREY